MKYIIKTTYPCVIKTQTEYVELDETAFVECEDEKYLYVYPQNGNIPFCIDLCSRTDNAKYSFFTHNNQNFVLLESQPQVSITKKESVTLNGKLCHILIDAENISFEGSNRIVKHRINHSCKNYKIIKIANYACVQFDNDFYAFDTQKDKLYHFCGDEIVLDKNTLSISKSYNDNSTRERKYTISFTDKVSIQENTFVHKAQNVAELIPFEFLEAVKAEDFSCALNMLNDNLKEKIDKPELQSFFGKIEQVLPININDFILLSQKQKAFVSFQVENGKICDISLDSL